MNDETDSGVETGGETGQEDSRAGSPARGEQPEPAPSRGLRIDQYEGLRAGEAIVAVRERGLRPSLERVEGYEARLQGFVVSQEPAAGVEVAADSQVFLYIGAPARAVVEGGEESLVEEEKPEEEEEEEPVAAAVEEATVECNCSGRGCGAAALG